MRRYELPFDKFLTEFDKILRMYRIKRVWSYGEFNGFNALRSPGFFVEGIARQR